MLAGALSVLRPAGCALVGGHSGEGPELALGERPPVGPGRPCDALPRQVEHLPSFTSCLDPTSFPHCAAAHAGFTVQGSAPRDALLSKGGAAPGQALVLTKPLGTGARQGGAWGACARGLRPNQAAGAGAAPRAACCAARSRGKGQSAVHPVGLHFPADPCSCTPSCPPGRHAVCRGDARRLQGALDRGGGRVHDAEQR